MAQNRSTFHERDFGTTVREVIIVLAIIGVLLAIAVPGVGGGGLQRNRENASAGNAANLALACFNYSTDNGTYPTGKTSTDAFKSLFPTYLQDGRNLFLTKRGGHEPFTGASLGSLSKANVCWTITMNKGVGLTGSDSANLPLLLSDLGGNYPTFPAGETNVTLPDNNIWGGLGVTVARLDQSSAFIRPKADSPNQVTLTNAKFQPAPGAVYASIAP